MFTQEQLEGIIYSLAYPEIEITKDERQSIGYRIRLRITFRARNDDFLIKLRHTLQDKGIESYYKDREKEGRPYPLLRLTNVDNLIKFLRLIDLNEPTSNNRFDSFEEVLTIVSNKHHLRQKGFERILEIKGLLT